MLTETKETNQAWIELRQQVNYWKSQHQRALEREQVLRKRVEELEDINRQQAKQIKSLTQEVQELKALAALLQSQLFGRKTEQTPHIKENTVESPEDFSEKEKRLRGKQQGTNGNGRKLHLNLPGKETVHDLKEDQKRCHICSRSYRLLPETEDSQEIHIEIHLVRLIHKRKKYVSNCNCENTAIITAPPALKLIAKGMFSIDFWIHILTEKYLFQRPLNRIIETLKLEGLAISQGTLTGGLQKIALMVQPLYTAILERNRQAQHWHMDETRWMIFAVSDDPDSSRRWWLWVIVTKDTCAYILDPTRSGNVPKTHLGDDPHGIISSDRYGVYKTLGENIVHAFCWAHLRRDFIRIRDTRKRLRSWAQAWIDRINQIYRLNDKRLEAQSDHQAFMIANQALHSQINLFHQTFQDQLKETTLHQAQRKVLESLNRHWDGYTTFLRYAQVPMDNNLSERQLRNPVVGRKNYYGCGSEWSGTLTVALFTIFQTLLINHIHPKKFLKAYLEACAKNQGKPPENISEFLPWNLSEQQKYTWAYPESPP